MKLIAWGTTLKKDYLVHLNGSICKQILQNTTISLNKSDIIHSMHYSYNQSHIPTNAPNGIKTYVWFIILLYPFVGIYIIDYFEHILHT